jgi:hypothetical protein
MDRCNLWKGRGRSQRLSVSVIGMDHCLLCLRPVSTQCTSHFAKLYNEQSKLIGSLTRPFLCFKRRIRRHNSQMHEGDARRRHVVSTFELTIVTVGRRRCVIEALNCHEALMTCDGQRRGQAISMLITLMGLEFKLRVA